MNQLAATPINALSIAGSDPGGGAGVQADLKTFSALGAYGLAVLTSLTAQNTRGVRAVHVPPPGFLCEQLKAISDDVRIDTVKIGMLADAAAANVVADWLEATRPPVVVLDPVMVATSGDRLLEPDAVQVVRERLVPLADLVTPNLPELAVLAGGAAPNPALASDPGEVWDAALADAETFARRAGVRILVKGGHLPGPGAPDALVEPEGAVHVLHGERIETTSTHGTGCTLSSAVAALRPRRATWLETVTDAKLWLTEALRAAGRLDVGGLKAADGSGPSHGPVHHFHALWPSPVAPPGSTASARFCDQAWARIGTIRTAIDALPFVRGLAEGTLDAARFTGYLAQDAIYLQEFARAMSRCAELAPTVGEQVWWTRHARECLEAERALHERTLAQGGEITRRYADPVTTAYVNHLHAVAGFGSYGRLAAAVLPCFWIYADVGSRLLEAGPGPDHPYREWIELYADPGFARATDELRALVDDLADRADIRERDAMLEDFVTSSRYEWSFWDQAWRGSPWPV